MTQLAKYVKEMRKQFGLTQVDLSQKSGVGLRFVRELEQGKVTLRLDKVNQVLALAEPEFQLPYGDYKFRCRLTPVRHNLK